MITFYSTHCPQCKVLEKKLKDKNIEYNECDNVDEMIAIGLKSAPALKIDEKILGFADAVKWIKNYAN